MEWGLGVKLLQKKCIFEASGLSYTILMDLRTVGVTTSNITVSGPTYLKLCLCDKIRKIIGGILYGRTIFLSGTCSCTQNLRF